jgi:hypothetical protein
MTKNTPFSSCCGRKKGAQAAKKTKQHNQKKRYTKVMKLKTQLSHPST